MSPQSKYWGDVSPLSHRDRRPWLEVRLMMTLGWTGDSLSYHDDMAFSTADRDNDLHMSNCAEENGAGWWFNSCSSSNLNGVYQSTGSSSLWPWPWPLGLVRRLNTTLTLTLVIYDATDLPVDWSVGLYQWPWPWLWNSTTVTATRPYDYRL